MTLAPGSQRWTEPVYAAGMDGRVYRTGIADAVVVMEDEGIRRHFPGFTRIRALHGRGIWRGQLRPLAKSYDVVVDMAVGCADARVLYPASVGSVRVLGGGVRPADDGTPVPHLYGPQDDPRGANLCLYYPPDEDMLLGNQVAEKLLPWAYEWLHYYEMWLVTGVWSGPEAPHPVVETSPNIAEPLCRDRSVRKLKAVDSPLMRNMSYALALRIASDRARLAAAAQRVLRTLVADQVTAHALHRCRWLKARPAYFRTIGGRCGPLDEQHP